MPPSGSILIGDEAARPQVGNTRPFASLHQLVKERPRNPVFLTKFLDGQKLAAGACTRCRVWLNAVHMHALVLTRVHIDRCRAFWQKLAGVIVRRRRLFPDIPLDPRWLYIFAFSGELSGDLVCHFLF
jgi:hypothetical protein